MNCSLNIFKFNMCYVRCLKLNLMGLGRGEGGLLRGEGGLDISIILYRVILHDPRGVQCIPINTGLRNYEITHARIYFM